jgi:hypothetical protein
MGIAIWPMIELEADDALASAAHLSAQDGAVEKSVSGPTTKISRSASAEPAWCRWIGEQHQPRRGRRPGKVRGGPFADSRLPGARGDPQDGYPGIGGIAGRLRRNS